MANMLYEALIFRREKAALYRVDPRVKLVVLIVYVAAIVSTYSVTYLAVIIASIAVASAGLANPRRIFQSLMASWRFLLILFLVIYLFSSAPSLISLRAAYNGIVAVAKLASLMLVFSMFFTTTHPDDLAQALVRMGIRFDIAYTLVLSMRFVPTVVKDIQLVYDAQRSRGLELEKGPFFERLRRMVPVLVPAFVITFLRVDKVAEAMESRAFGAASKRTFMYELRIGAYDVWIATLLCMVPLIVLVLGLIAGVNPDGLVAGAWLG